jgi:dUTP pyrophosphatase
MQLSPNATIPKQVTPGSIGYDVTSTQHIIIQPGDICKISTGLATALPEGMYICIAPQSSNALRHL